MKPTFIRSRSRGFGLLELVVVIAVIGVLAAIALPLYRSSALKAEAVDVFQRIDRIRTAVEVTAQQWGGDFCRRFASRPVSAVDFGLEPGFMFAVSKKGGGPGLQGHHLELGFMAACNRPDNHYKIYVTVKGCTSHGRDVMRGLRQTLRETRLHAVNVAGGSTGCDWSMIEIHSGRSPDRPTATIATAQIPPQPSASVPQPLAQQTPQPIPQKTPQPACSGGQIVDAGGQCFNPPNCVGGSVNLTTRSCDCPTGNLLSPDGHCFGPPACAGGTVNLVTRRCECPPATTLAAYGSDKGTCLPNPPGTGGTVVSTPTGLTRQCASPQIKDSQGSCFAPPRCVGGTVNLATRQCECSGGQLLGNNGRCFAPPACAGGTVNLSTRRCECLDTTKPDLVNGTCLAACTGGKLRQGTGCACPSGRPVDIGGSCYAACGAGEERVGTTCLPQCTGGRTRGPQGGCACPSNKPYLVNGVCTNRNCYAISNPGHRQQCLRGIGRYSN